MLKIGKYLWKMTKFTIYLHQKEENAIQLLAVNIYKRRFNKQTSIFGAY